MGKEKATFFPGVFVHAQALAQIDGRFFHNWDAWEQFLLLFCVGLAGAAAWPLHQFRADFLLGIALNHYRLERTVFHGAHAVSNRARHHSLGRLDLDGAAGPGVAKIIGIVIEGVLSA